MLKQTLWVRGRARALIDSSRIIHFNSQKSMVVVSFFLCSFVFTTQNSVTQTDIAAVTMPVHQRRRNMITMVALLLVPGTQAFTAQQPFLPSALSPRRVVTTLSVASSSSPPPGPATTDPFVSKQIRNATQRIVELDLLVEQADAKIDRLDERMQLVGDDYELFDLQREKERIEKQIAKYLKEWDTLEELLEREGALE